MFGIYACTILCLCFFPWSVPQLQSDWSLSSCDHRLDCASQYENNKTQNSVAHRVGVRRYFLEGWVLKVLEAINIMIRLKDLTNTT